MAKKEQKRPMKINNYANEIRTLVLYGANIESEKEINPYNAKAFFESENIFKENVIAYDDYFKIVIDSLIECSANPTHINAKKRNNKIFVVWRVGKYGGVNGSLYIPFSKVIKHEVIEEKKDMRGDGCINVSYNDKIVFDNDIKIICKNSKSYFAKSGDPIPNESRYNVEDLEELIKHETERAQKYPAIFKNDRLLKLYNEQLKQGKKYRVFEYRCEDRNYQYLMLYNCVDHYEKSKEYIKAEKLTEEIKKINNKWDVDDTIKLLKLFRLTKKRK